MRKYFSGLSYFLPVKEGSKVCQERGHSLETEGREVADLFRDTAFDPE